MNRATLHAWLGTIGLMGAVAFLDRSAGMRHALFPELSALAFAVLTNPAGKWGRKLWALAVSPAAAGAIGVAVGRRLGLTPFSVALTVGATLALLAFLRSSVVPAVSAGLLALFLNIDDFRYALWILIDGLLLAALLHYRSIVAGGLTASEAAASEEADFTGRLKVGALVVVFAALIAALSRATGMPYLLFPPLVVITYEALEDPECRWLSHPARTLAFGFLGASFGVVAARVFGMNAAAVAAVLALALSAQAFLDAFIPPGLAISLIPFLIAKPSWQYPASVVGGICFASFYYRLCSKENRTWKTTP